jgi:hypothetical protein
MVNYQLGKIYKIVDRWSGQQQMLRWLNLRTNIGKTVGQTCQRSQTIPKANAFGWMLHPVECFRISVFVSGQNAKNVGKYSPGKPSIINLAWFVIPPKHRTALHPKPPSHPSSATRVHRVLSNDDLAIGTPLQLGLVPVILGYGSVLGIVLVITRSAASIWRTLFKIGSLIWLYIICSYDMDRTIIQKK